ncbi:MAG: GNAT family N-acetyltransferase [Spirosomataceae bacterium]
MAAEVVLLTENNLHPYVALTLELWPDCDYREEELFYRAILNSVNDYCALAKNEQRYVGFIHIAIRSDHVEGADTDKTAYLEGIYIQPSFRRTHLATLLLKEGERWAISKGFTQLASDTEIANFHSQLFHKNNGFEEVNRIVCFLKNL